MTNLWSKSKKYPRLWFVTLDNDVKDVDILQVRAYLTAVTENKHDWSRFGYKFAEIDPINGHILRKTQNNVFWIRISSNETIYKECHIGGLSCASLTDNVIFLNNYRWNNGSVMIPKVPLPLYRYMVVSHEIGHLLGHMHRKCSGRGNVGDVMQEFTRTGWQGCSPNLYPLYD